MADYRNLIKSTLAAPMGDVIASVGAGVAEAQAALDEGSLATMLDIYSEGGDEKFALMRDIGYKPTFYALPETIGEIQIALKLGTSQTSSSSTPAVPAAPVAPGNAAISAGITTSTPVRQRLGSPVLASRLAAQARPMRARMYGTPVDAGYTNRHNFSASTSAKLTFKIVPVPPPEGVENLRVMPNISGYSAQEAQDMLSALDLIVGSNDPNVSLDEIRNKFVLHQSIEPNVIVTAGDTVLIDV